MFGLPKNIVIFDTEYTTWKGALQRNWSGPGECRELIQLAAALVETKDFAELDSCKVWVRPRINPILSDYCVNLTRISQQELDERGLDFAPVLADFHGWCRRHEIYFFNKFPHPPSDLDILIENCDLYGLELPFDAERFHNINEVFLRYGIFVQQSGMAPAAFGVELQHRPHDALNDVRGIIEGLKLLKKKVA